MNKDKALKMCLEYIETDAQGSKFAILIKEALAKPDSKDKEQAKTDSFVRQLDEALAQPEPWEKFCDSNCVWTDHHPDCKLAQPEQEPVAWMNDSTPSGIFARHIDGARNFGCTIPLYTTPPQRTWVGLMRGVRVEGDTVVISVKGGNDAARELCGALIEEMNR